MEVQNDKVILRDFIESDIDDQIRWETIETEWQLWDAPWENEEGEPFDADSYRKERLEWLAKEKEKDAGRMRWSFQICVNDAGRKHIGWPQRICYSCLGPVHSIPDKQWHRGHLYADLVWK